MTRLSTHILDTSIGKPAEGVQVILEQFENNHWKKIGEANTTSDGRINSVSGEVTLKPGNYKLVFEVEAYFKRQNINSIYPRITIEFTVASDSHYHIPLLLNPFGYSTYRGS